MTLVYLRLPSVHLAFKNSTRQRLELGCKRGSAEGDADPPKRRKKQQDDANWESDGSVDVRDAHYAGALNGTRLEASDKRRGGAADGGTPKRRKRDDAGDGANMPAAQCGICLTNMVEGELPITQLDCNSVCRFHTSCVQPYVRVHGKCPRCDVLAEMGQ